MYIKQIQGQALNFSRYLSSSSWILALPKKHKLPPRPKWLIVESEIDEKFLKGGRGPGGQKINKTNSKVQLTHIPTGLVVTCQYSRSQEGNRKRAREILAHKLEDLQNPEGSRNKVIEERKGMVKKNKAKKSNRKYKEIDEQRKIEKQLQDEKDAQIIDVEEEFQRMISGYSEIKINIEDEIKKVK
ncbi:hypothetical protein CAAN1_19S02058 [[Candida] anglica]|uniref:Prokaryotic-type class I peptide chain release factors domain-containing protein n=1 Tax=[Candida] anglica TaxID=148631 RepID=A0ABP0E5B3_9ASCO